MAVTVEKVTVTAPAGHLWSTLVEAEFMAREARGLARAATHTP